MTDQHPITPPPELVGDWLTEAADLFTPANLIHIATRAAHWGADQELEACAQRQALIYGDFCADELRATRRPKPPTMKKEALKKEALKRLELLEKLAEACGLNPDDTIRLALEALPND